MEEELGEKNVCYVKNSPSLLLSRQREQTALKGFKGVSPGPLCFALLSRIANMCAVSSAFYIVVHCSVESEVGRYSSRFGWNLHRRLCKWPLSPNLANNYVVTPSRVCAAAEREPRKRIDQKPMLWVPIVGRQRQNGSPVPKSMPPQPPPLRYVDICPGFYTRITIIFGCRRLLLPLSIPLSPSLSPHLYPQCAISFRSSPLLSPPIAHVSVLRLALGNDVRCGF